MRLLVGQHRPRRRVASCAPVLLLLLLSGRVAAAESLIDAPHSYYYRELYLPALTAGPSALAWAPDSHELVYSMGGSLWRQRTDSGVARQLTDGAGYDYQPDWSPDGRYIVYVSSSGEALELKLLDVTSGQSTQLTHEGAVNLEPRFSPDGRRIVFVSTAYHRHFHVFVAQLRDGRLDGVVRLTGENRSTLPRYYYSPYDHEINPTWTRDGSSILFVSNRGHIHGTGGLWRMAATPGSQPLEIHYEETNWQMRPELAPDGQRIVYSSYLGRNWLQLWLMPGSGGADAFPLTYGEWDNTTPRWSPDGREIAFISNRDGGTQLRLLHLPGAAERSLMVSTRQRLRPYGAVHVVVRDERGRPTAARIVVTDAAGRFYAPAGAWTHHAEFDRNATPFEARYFHSTGDDVIDVPAGAISIEAMKGLERSPVRRTVTVAANETTALDVALPARPWGTQADHWASADVHVHMNYGGHYRNTPAHLVLQAQAEGLDIIENLIVNKEQRIPDIAYSGQQVDPASRADTLIVHGQEFHTSYWGHLGLIGLKGNILLPGYSGYPNTAAASLYPMNADVADLAHAQGGLVGFAHPFEEEPQPLTHPVHTDADELPVDVALGKVDYLEVVSFADHQATASVWYRLLNLGFRLPAAGGTDAMADYATLRGPVGLNRVYARLPDATLSADAWLASLRAGRTFATNAPLLDFSLGDKPIGASLELEHARTVAFSARLRSIVPVDHAQVVCNGQVVRELPLGSAREALKIRGTLPLTTSGWCVLRAFSAQAEYPILDNFIYGTTSPVYVTIAGAQPHSPQDARFFLAWIDNLAQRTAAYPDWTSAEEKAAVLKKLADARAVYERLQ